MGIVTIRIFGIYPGSEGYIPHFLQGTIVLGTVVSGIYVFYNSV